MIVVKSLCDVWILLDLGVKGIMIFFVKFIMDKYMLYLKKYLFWFLVIWKKEW